VQFKDIIGQQATKDHLINMFRQNRLSHALLFLSKEGSGSLSLARAFAQFVLCEKVNGKPHSDQQHISLFGEETENNEHLIYTDSCGVCPACLKSSKMMHPDIHFSFPVTNSKKSEPKSDDFISEFRNFLNKTPYGNLYSWLQAINAENKQGNIYVEECKEISKKLNLKSFEAEYKFLIMWMPEKLGNEGNRLLKLIEEPPPNTIFIFVAENEQLILPTIISRTQLVKIPSLSASEVKNALVNIEGLEENQANQMAILSEGNYFEALQNINDPGENWNVLLRDWLNTIVKSGPMAQLKWVEEIAKIGREKQKQFLKYFNFLIEHSIRIRTMGEKAFDSSLLENEKYSDITDFAVRMNKLCDISQLDALVKEIDTASYHIERNANAKILFHSLTIKLYHIISNKSVILVS
jgi:DNA polymerase-3 subunit delta'